MSKTLSSPWFAASIRKCRRRINRLSLDRDRAGRGDRGTEALVDWDSADLSAYYQFCVLTCMDVRSAEALLASAECFCRGTYRDTSTAICLWNLRGLDRDNILVGRVRAVWRIEEGLIWERRGDRHRRVGKLRKEERHMELGYKM